MKPYFTRQLSKSYFSTIQLIEFLSTHKNIHHFPNVLDLCCGAGTLASYLRQIDYKGAITLVDNDNSLITFAREYFADLYPAETNLNQFIHGDIYDLSSSIQSECYNLVSLLQVLSWIPSWNRALKFISKINHEYLIGFALFYDGLISTDISIAEHHKTDEGVKSSSYNIFLIPIFEQTLISLRYSNIRWKKFKIPEKLTHSDVDIMGTYTKFLHNGKLLQCSAPIFMPWYFFLSRVPP